MKERKNSSKKSNKEFDITKTGAKIDLPEEELKEILDEYNKYIKEQEVKNGGE